MKISLKVQKYICITILTLINILLSTTFLLYANKWYIYLFILAFGSFINSTSVILLLFYKLFNKVNKQMTYRKNPKKYTNMVDIRMLG